MSSRRRERPVQTGSSNKASARSARSARSNISKSKSTPVQPETRAGAFGEGLSFRSEEEFEAKPQDDDSKRETARGQRTGFMDDKKGYFFEGSWHPRQDHTNMETHKVAVKLEELGNKDRRYKVKGFPRPVLRWRLPHDDHRRAHV